ncbi:matrix-remodeling-associated protein 5-like isoform X2 [Corythoichthys intestinalis]|uniref:matrix-remodeling-associated protein 5-like isoform X2 n=1 Tax=Corythoichthys intestinalis TaxID=161448 RepID=UPI0025A6615F|nr:matrix-remodeling-associated protein 5-like isoform X2 [Corythoichthys intestinalis]
MPGKVATRSGFSEPCCTQTYKFNLALFNSISRIHDKSLAGLQRLELLMLHSNDIHHLPDALFRDLKSLQILKLSYNKLTEIPSSQTFSGLRSLLRLYLDHNHLQYIHPRALLQLPSLRLLRLQGNKLHQLHPHALCTLSLLNTYYFSTLRHLDVSNNSLSTLPRATLQTAQMLETLALQANPWSCDCSMNWLASWRFLHPELMKCSGGLQCPICESPNALQGQGLFDQKDLACTSPVITLGGEETPSETDLGEIQPSESFREPLGAASLDLSDQLGNSVELHCNISHSADSPAPDLSLPSSSPVAMALSFSLECFVARESYESLWRILAYYSETAVHLEREIMLSKAPELAYRYRQTAETEGYYNTGVKASVATGPHWLMQPAIGIQLNRAQSSRDVISLIYSTRVSAHPDPTTPAAASTTASHPWVLILTNNTSSAITGLAGISLDLFCPILSSGNPRVQWILPDGSKLISPSSSQDGRIQVSDSRLRILNAELSNAGIYYCVAQAGKDLDVMPLQVVVEMSSAPQSGEQVGHPVTGGAGQPVSLSCRASGSPGPHIYWVLPDGNIVKKGLAGVGGLTVQSNGSLFFPNPTLRDAGHYRCVAVNQYDSASLSMTLEINQRKTLSLGDVPGGPQSASGRSTKIRAPLLSPIEEGSGVELEENERPTQVYRKHNIPFSHSSNRLNQVRKPLRQGPLREGPLRRGGRPLSPEQRRNRYSANKQKIDPLKWADILAKIRQKTIVSDNSEDIKTEKPTANSLRRDEVSERHEGNTDNAETEGIDASEMEGSSVDDTILQQESLQPVYPTLAIVVTTQAQPESKLYTETQTYDNEHENVTPQTKTQTDSVNLNPTIEINETDPDQARAEEQEANPTSARVSPIKPQKGQIPNLVRNTRPQSPWNSRRRIGQRRRVISRTRGRSKKPLRPLPDSLKSVTPDTTITQMARTTTTISPTSMSEEIENIKTQFSTSNVDTVNPPLPSVLTTVDITTAISDLLTPTSSSPTSLPPDDTETNTDVMTHSGNIPDSVESPVFKSQTLANTDSYDTHTNTQTTLGLNEDRPSGEKGERLENNLLDVPNGSQFSTPLLATLTVSLTTTHPISFINNPGSTSASDPFVATVDDPIPIMITFASPTENPIPLTLPHTSIPTERVTTYSSLTSTTPTIYSPTTISPTTSFIRPDNPDQFKNIPSTTIPVLSTSDTSTPTQNATPGTVTETIPSASSISTTTTTASSATASSGERPNIGQVIPKGRPVSGVTHESRPPTDWRNPGANFIPDSHSSRPQWSPSPLPAAPRTPVLRTRPRIADPHIRTVSIPAGTIARLTCEAQGDPKPSITWTKVATGAVMSLHSKAQRFAVLSNGTLTIQNVQLQDRGTYICSAHSLFGRDRLLTTLEVWTRPPRMQLASYREATIHQGGEVHLECQASGVPTPLLSWVLPNRSVLTSMTNSSNRITMDQNGTLHISSTLLTDRGSYRCVASNPAGAASASVRLHVTSLPPVIQQPREEHLFLNSGGPVYAHCTARGAPPPTLRWRIPDGTLVRPSQFLHGNLFVLPNGTLHIRKVGPKDTGSYECTSVNAVGTDKRTVRVELQKEAQEEVTSDPKNIPVSSTVLKNRSSPHSGFQSKPLDSARLTPLSPKSPFYPHQPTYADSASKINRTVITSPSQLTNLTKTSVGTHHSKLTSNTSDKGRPSVILHALPVAPFSKAQIVSTSPSVTAVSYGENLQLHCSVTGNPSPIIIWRTPNRKLVDMNFSYDRRLKVHQNGTLSVQSVTDRDVGDYLCIARNKVADDYRLLRVSVVIKPAKIEPKQPFNQMVSFGKALKVDCLASGLPDPSVSWSLPDGTMVNSFLQGEERAGRGRRLIVFNNGTLLVPAVGRGEEGEYTCYAENQGGQDTMKVQVKVMMTSPPIINDDKSYQVIKVRQGSTAIIRCQAAGDPPPTVMWLSPAHRVIPSSSGFYSDRVVVASAGTLEVHRAQKIDAGNYTCRASNSAGERSMVVGLEVDVPNNGYNGYSDNISRIRTINGINKATNSLNPVPRSDSENGFKKPSSGITTQLGHVVRSGVKSDGNIGVGAENSGTLNRNTHGTLNSMRRNSPSSDTEGSDTSNLWARSNDVAVQKAKNGVNPSRNIGIVSGISRNGVFASSTTNNGDGRASWVRADLGSRTSAGSAGTGSTPNKLVGVATTGKQRIIKGQTVLLPCPSYGSPPLTWYLPGNGVLLAPYYGSRLTVHRNGSLELRSARVSDSGTLVCVVKGDTGETRIQVELEVSEPQEASRPLLSLTSRSAAVQQASQSARLVPELPRPIVSLKSSQRGPSSLAAPNPVGPPAPSPISEPAVSTQTASLMSITNGETLRLPCYSSQTPKHSTGSLSWTFPSGKVMSRGDSGDSGRYLVQEDGTLIIQQASVFDRGTYTCRSTNPETSSVSVVTVPVIIIAYPPRITTGPSPVTYTRPGVAVELPCLTIATPRAMVTWETPDMTQLRVLGQARIYGNRYLSPQGSLVIQKPSSRDTGFYRCTAKNVVGVDTKTTYLHVI